MRRSPVKVNQDTVRCIPHTSSSFPYTVGFTWDQVNQDEICLTHTYVVQAPCNFFSQLYLPGSENAPQVGMIDLYIEPSCPYPRFDLPWSVNMARKEDFWTTLHTQIFWFSTTVEVNYCLHMACIQSGCWSLSSCYASFSSYSPLLWAQSSKSRNSTSKTPSWLLPLLTQTAHAHQPGIMDPSNMLLPSPSMETQRRLIW